MNKYNTYLIKKQRVFINSQQDYYNQTINKLSHRLFSCFSIFGMLLLCRMFVEGGRL